MGYQLKGGDADHLRQIKFTIGLSQIPEAAALYTSQSHNSENRALKETILDHVIASPAQIIVFDRGITSRATYDELSRKGIRFVSRVNAGAKHKVIGDDRLTDQIQTAGLLFEQDIDVQLYREHGIKSSEYLRCIKAKTGGAENGKKAKELWFITNIASDELSAMEVAEVYKRRWDIETFSKFLKQHMNFSHLISRSENGIRVMFYVTMIAAILILAYRKLSGASGYKIVKQRMAQELETEMLKTIIGLCGGDPAQLQKILRPNSS